MNSIPTERNGEISLPSARRERWQPLRGGLLNLYRYDHQEFRYEDGRLLLRGNNGTGKSRVLALQLPFLLDGEIIPQRVEPDQDTAKRMEWNLLLGGKYDDRLGYTWIEFGRMNEAGEAEYKTFGCALRAVQGRGIAQQWFFTTTQRIGRDLFLENEAGQPLSWSKLQEVVGSRGRVFHSGRIEEDRREYRAAVDSALFNLGDRYEALINLLIQLRQPQLSRTLNEARLSEALSQALPPLPEAVLGDVAEAFRSLEADRQELNDFKAARDSAELFLKEYGRYIQIAACRRAEDVRKTHSAYESTMRRLRAAEQALDQSNKELHDLDERISQLDIEERKAMSAESTLRDSPEMKDAKALEQARQDSVSRQTDADRAQKEAERAAAASEKAEAQRQLAAAKLARAAELAETAAHQASQTAGSAGLDQLHRDQLKRIGMPNPDPDRIESAATALHAAIQRRRDAARHVQRLNEEVASAQRQFILAKQGFAQCESDLTENVEAESKAVAGVKSETTSLAARYRTWAAELKEIQSAEFDDMESALADWCEAPQGESPVAAAVKQAERGAAGRIETQSATVRVRLQSAQQECVELEAELARVRDGFHAPPPLPYTRDDSHRVARPGAPFWKVCEFMPDVSSPHRANIEAALEAAGLLDAWITPDGAVLDRDDHDTLFDISGSAEVAEGARLDAILRPAIPADDVQAKQVTEQTVADVLRRIGFGAGTGTVWVDAAGHWKIGPLTGCWNKPVSEHIGHAAREAARMRKMEELAGKVQLARNTSESIQRDLDLLAKRLEQVTSEAAQAPDDGALRGALAQVETSRASVSRARLRLSEAEARMNQLQRALREKTDQRNQAASDLGIADWIERIGELLEALHAYSESLASLWPAIRSHCDAREQSDSANERARDAAVNRDSRRNQSREAEAAAAAALEKFKTLEATVGAAVREVQEKLKDAVQRVQRAREELRKAGEDQTAAKVRQGVAATQIQDATEELKSREQERGGAIARLTDFAATRQLAVAHGEFAGLEPGPWSVARAVEIARRIDAVLAEVDHGDDAWNRNQREIHAHFETLQSSLRAHGQMPEGSVTDGIFVVSIQFQGRSCTIAELRDGVVAIIQERQELLDAREREVLENYLIDEVAEHLHDLLHRALKWKDEINEELGERPMSTGLTLRFVWEPLPDLPQAFTETRRLLLGARGTWSPAERAAVGEFLQQQIQAVRTANDTGTWQDHLTQAFDYRRWHQFGVERKQDGVWKRLTRRTHGTGSGGEKAVALTLPQLAAAAAHYRSASRHAPRLILLDEAFVGVDKNMRAKCMDLLRVFDLDVVMTSESEWGCYPTVPAIAIYQLSAREGIDAVHAARWVWNGKQRVRDDAPFPGARPAGNAEAPAAVEQP